MYKINQMIRYYRQVLNQLLEELPSSTGSYFLMKQNIEEGRLHLGNMLKYINKEPSPYRKATLKRLSGESDYIPESTDREPVIRFPDYDKEYKNLDYIRELLQEMIDHLFKIDMDNERVNLYLKSAIEKLTIARNYGGIRLGEIRDETT